MGLRGRLADRARLDSVRITNNNDQHFNYSPAAGGIKITRTMGLTVRDSLFSANWGKGLWLDQSVSDSTIVGNDFLSNKQNGISLELSATATVADNRFLDNTSDAIKINNTQNVQIWNNTFRGNARTVWVAQDDRHAADPEDTYDLDPRRPVPDPRMTWYVGPITVANNIIVQPKAGACIVCVEDYTHERSAEQIGVHTHGNVYNRIDTTTAKAIIWSKGIGNPTTFATINAYRTATGQDTNSLVTDGTPVLTTTGDLTTSVADQTDTVATALPSKVASTIGQQSGTKHLGAF
jgi:trimeric autotransporter adhesin